MTRARRASCGAVIVLLGLAAPDVAPAARDAKYCAPRNEYCVGTFVKRRTGRTFDVAGFKLRGRYELCVRAPRARVRCKTFRLRRNAAGAYASTVRWTQHFPHRRRGVYRVRWNYRGRLLGRELRFSG